MQWMDAMGCVCKDGRGWDWKEDVGETSIGRGVLDGGCGGRGAGDTHQGT